MEVLGLIPARGGSKGVPRKNIRILWGKPLIVHTILAAEEARSLSRLIVSTDDDEIAAVARAYEAEVPFLRPRELAADDTPDLPVFRHVLEVLADREGYRPDLVVHLRPTSPRRKPEHIDAAVSLLVAHPEVDSVRSISLPRQNPYKMWRIKDGMLAPLIPAERFESYNAPRQHLPTVYWQNGYVDAAWYRTIMNLNSMTGERILPLIIDDDFPLDLDSPSGFALAELVGHR